MIKIIILLIVTAILLSGLLIISKAQSSSKYTFMFRNVILSESKTHELAPVLRGRVYYPRYFFIPSSNQYFVYSDVDETGPFKVYERNTKPDGKTYALLNEKGHVVDKVETPLRFSSRSGSFYGPHTYIPYFETGNNDTLPYHQVHNSALDMEKSAFEKLYLELHNTAEYVEFINLRASRDNDHQAGVIFKIQGKVEILLSGLRNSHMIRRFQEDLRTNNSDDYYLPDIRNTESYPQSPPSLEMVPLETNDTDPFSYWRTRLNPSFSIKKYNREGSSGWYGIMELAGIPISVPGESYGTASVRFKTRGETFNIKILEVEKADYRPLYNLGLRTFELPESIRTNESLVFMESVQDRGENRLGGGVFVVRSTNNTNPSADIPSDMTEEHFNTLPLNLQAALLDPENTTSLKLESEHIRKWIPEIERLTNLTHLEMSTGMTEIPDEIANLTKLENLSMTRGKLQKISPKIADLKALKDIDLFSNQFTEFPRVLLELEGLERLKIGGNDISSVPDDINRLENLKYLGISVTPIYTLPESITGMKELFVDDTQDLKNKLPAAYTHLFDYNKIIEEP